jgi:hypothetical protein
MSNIELLNQLLNLTVWLPIKDYPNYEISISGSVRNVKTKRILNPYINSNGYYRIDLHNNGKRKKFYIHRLVISNFIPNIENKKCVDHINGKRLDNTISNLRWSSDEENQHNRQINLNNTSSIKGVYWNKKANKWHAQININGKNIHLGLFDNLDDAKLVRQKKAAELFGEFLNACEK